jgi:ATP-binding cassette subfamily F protein uup
MSYLSDFLFSPARANSPVRTLSGGERNRVLLARLLALPANVLVLDEPTNDLDIDTLELLEELLQAYAGTVFLVSHDRRFLDNVVTSTIAWEGDAEPGLWREYEGGYEDWRTQRQRADALRDAGSRAGAAAARPRAAAGSSASTGSAASAASAAVSASTPAAPAAGKPASVTKGAPAKGAQAKRKLSYKEQRELDELPDRIEALEIEQKELAALLASAELYAEDPVRAEAAQRRHAQIDDELLAALERWEALGTR